MGAIVFHILKEPVKGYELKVGVIPTDLIIIPSIQRELSESLVKKLSISIEKVGFVDPIQVIEREDGLYEVINGQHRLEALKALGYREILAVVLPYELRNYIITLNVEKAPSLKDKSHQAYELYMEFLRSDENLEEYELESMIEEPYYITVGFAIKQVSRFPAYAFERILKKVDTFLNLPLKDAKVERERRAELLLRAGEVLNEKYKELGLQNALQKEAIVSRAFQNIYGKRVRIVEDDFYTVFEKLIREIQNIQVAPEEGEEIEL